MVTSAPTMATNITGFRTIRRGSSFRKESQIAGIRIVLSNNERALTLAAMVRILKTAWLELSIKKCSTMGPRLMAGKKVRAPTMMTVPMSSSVKVTPETGKLPALTGTVFLAPRLPARASTGTMSKKRPMSIASPRVRLYQGVLADRPAKALPLLPIHEVKA